MRFDHGDILYNEETGVKGIALTTEHDYVVLLLYDFTTAIESIEDVVKIGSSDSIYKSMYELNMCKVTK